MKNNNPNCSAFSNLLPIGFLFILFAQCSSILENETALEQNSIIEEKQKGVHLFGIKDSTNFQPLIQNNIEWITLVAWGYQEDIHSPIMKHHNGDSLQIQQRNAKWLERIALVQNAGFKVFVKPHIWLSNPSDGKWRSDIFPTSEENWELWKISYRDYIIRYAKIAEQANAEMFCIGTELTRLSVEKPIFWKTLLQEVRSIYTGKITYAANWYNEFEKIVFWEDLDFIGIQAYFPLVKNEYPTVLQISAGWNEHLPLLEKVHKKYNRKILFTELGYKSTSDSAIEPWLWLEHSDKLDKSFSEETQANCYEAFFKSIWNKEWFVGVHIWQMRTNSRRNRKSNNLDFTPQGKLAEKIIAKGFE